MIRNLRIALAILGVTVALATGSIILTGASANDGCERDYRTISTLRTIVERSQDTIDKYVREGTLTPEQGQRAHRENGQALDALVLPDCQPAGL